MTSKEIYATDRLAVEGLLARIARQQNSAD